MKKLTILHINKFHYLKGGAEVSLFETANLLRSKGHKIVFFSMLHPRNSPSEYEKYFVSNVDYDKDGFKNKINVSLKILYSFEAKRKIKELIENEKPDIVHLNNIYHQLSPSILHAIKKFNLPVVMSLRDYKMVCASYSMLVDGKPCEACCGGRYFRVIKNRCVKNSLTKSTLCALEMYSHHKILHIYDSIKVFISPSKFLKNKIKEMGFKGSLVYLPNFVKLEDFEPVYDWQDNSIAYVGRLSKEKGLFTLIDAVKGLNVKLKIIGEGALKDELLNKIQKDKINNIFFLGYMKGEELKKEIRKSMFIVAPSEWYENSPRSVIEAFALGKPAIASRIGGIPELVRDNMTGLSFEPGNLKDLRFKIECLINKPDKIIEMGRNARIMVEQELNPEKHYERLMEIYKQVIA